MYENGAIPDLRYVKKQDAQRCTSYAITCVRETEKRKGTEKLWKNTRETSNAMIIIVNFSRAKLVDKGQGIGDLFLMNTL